MSHKNIDLGEYEKVLINMMNSGLFKLVINATASSEYPIINVYVKGCFGREWYIGAIEHPYNCIKSTSYDTTGCFEYLETVNDFIITTKEESKKIKMASFPEYKFPKNYHYTEILTITPRICTSLYKTRMSGVYVMVFSEFPKKPLIKQSFNDGNFLPWHALVRLANENLARLEAAYDYNKYNMTPLPIKIMNNYILHENNAILVL